MIRDHNETIDKTKLFSKQPASKKRNFKQKYRVQFYSLHLFIRYAGF